MSSELTYQNPVLPGFYPDPSVCRVGEDYYLVTSSFEYFPGVPVFHSKNLVDWEQIGHCLTRKSQLNLDEAKSSGGIYAPTIRHHEGVFYMTTTDTSGIGNFIVTAEDPAGEWSEPIRVNQGGIDPSLFFENGKTYFQSNALHWNDTDGIYQSEIDLATGKRLTEPQFLWGGTGGKYPEAPHIYKKDGYYYLIVAEGGTEFTHKITMARSESIDGPYEACPDNPVLFHGGTRKRIQSTGHGDFIKDHEGNWWLMFLAVRHSHYPLVHHMGRETHLAPVEWEQGEWPVVNGGECIPLKVTAGRSPLAGRQLARTVWEDDFSGESLPLYWNFRRNPVEGSYQLGDGLRLKCLGQSLDDVQPLSFVGRRHQHFDSLAETELDFSGLKEGEEAGLTIQQNETHHCEVFVRKDAEGAKVLVRRRCGTLRSEREMAVPEGSSATLKMRSNEETYELGWGNEWCEEIETRHLSTEMAGGFTGVYIGLYATGNGGEALFKSFSYEDKTSGELEEHGAKSQVKRFYKSDD